MNKQVIIFGVFILIISSGFQSVSAEIFFPSNSFRQNGPSTYCIIEPSENISENQEQWVNLTSDAILEWENSLKDAESGNENIWNINQKKITNENDDGCDIIIEFKDKPDLLDSVAGFFKWPPGNIVIYYLEYTTCGLISCYKDDVFKSDDTIYAIVSHEVGHSLSLDHYVTDDNSLNIKWRIGNTNPPSVMIPSIHQNPSLMKITDIDVQKVRSIYGSDGFYAFSDIPVVPEPTPVPEPVPKPTPVPEPIPVPKPTPVPEPIPVPEPKLEPIIPVKPFDSMIISHKVIEINTYDREILKISGQISEEEFFRGQPVIITIHKPDQTVQVLKITSTETGYFETLLIYDKYSIRGIYHISASYVHHVDKDMDITFEVISEKIKDSTISKTSPKGFVDFESNSNEFEDKIPVWFKNNAKEWANEHIDDRIFISGIQYLIDHEIIKPLDFADRTYQNSKEIPQWVKNIAEFWVNDLITDDDFISSIQYLVDKQIINP